MTTKEQERKALEQIRKIVAGLGGDSYIRTAFEGCFEIAEENIENDCAYSMKNRWRTTYRQLNAAKGTIEELKDKLKKAQAENERLTAQLDQEMDWQDYEMKENVKQSDYDNLTQAGGTHYLTDDEAKDLLYVWYGFAKEKITIHKEVPTYQINRHGQLRRIGAVDRRPAYNATDWNYVRFDCGLMTYELYNDNLSFFYH